MDAYIYGAILIRGADVLRHNCVAQLQPEIPLDAYRVCVFNQNNKGIEAAYISLSLFYTAFGISSIWI